MRTQIGAYNAKTHLPELLREVGRGKSFTITHRGKAVAELVPVQDADRTAARRSAKQMRQFMRDHRIEGIDTQALREEGRR